MALDFPASPVSGQTFNSGGTLWQWDGTKWISGALVNTAFAPITSPIFQGDPQAPQPAAGDADASIATTQFVANAVGTANHNVGRNLLHNPLFNVAQRGAGPFTAQGYTLDRWVLAGGGLDTISVAQAVLADAGRAAIGDEEASLALSNAFTGNAAAGAWNALTQYIENVRRLGNKTVTVSFWAVAAAGTPKLGVSIDQYFGTGGSPSAAVNGNGTAVTISTTWTRYSVTLAVPSISGKTLGTANDHATILRIWYSSGATNNVRAGNIGVQSGTISLWGVQLEIGSVATPLEKPDPRYDLANCQRFAQAYYALRFNAYASAAYITSFGIPVMRAGPTLSFLPGGSWSLTNVAAGPFNTFNSNSWQIAVNPTAAGMVDIVLNGGLLLSADL